MKISAYVHGYPPEHNAGAEHMLYDTLNWFGDRGHDVKVLSCVHTGTATGGTHSGGVMVYHRPGKDVISSVLREADVILTHLDLTREAGRLAMKARRPLVHLVHNHWQLQANGVQDAPLVIFNSEHLACEARWRDRQQSWMVLHPPVPRRYATAHKGAEDGAVTLLNCNREKGGELFARLATKEPRRRWLGVLGAYGEQIRDADSPVTYLPTQADVRLVYSESRVVVMPSTYESYGRVPIEAAWSGIPTIYRPTAGLLEGIGPAGLPVAGDTVRHWQAMLKRLDRHATYEWYAARAVERASFLWRRSVCELEYLEERLGGLA